MTKRLMGWDGGPNDPAYWWHEDGSGNWAQEIAQNTEEILKFNHYLRTTSGGIQDKEVQQTSQIPIVCARIWEQQYGIDIYKMNDADAQAWMEKNIFGSNEWYKLRVDR